MKIFVRWSTYVTRRQFYDSLVRKMHILSIDVNKLTIYYNESMICRYRVFSCVGLHVGGLQTCSIFTFKYE